MENFKALIELSLYIFGSIFLIGSSIALIFNGRCEQDNREDDAVFWKRFYQNLEENKPN